MATDPVCGMWVDERTSTLRLVRDGRDFYFCSEGCYRTFAEPEAEAQRLRLRLVVAWPLAVAIVGLTYLVPSAAALWIAAGLAAVVQAYPAAPFYRGTLDAIRDRSWNMDVLIAVATTSAFVYSLVALAAPSRLPHAYYFDASALIVALLLTGRYVERWTRDRASSALRRLEELLPATATVVRSDGDVSVPVSEVRVGDLCRVRPAERFPADGIVREGRTSVDESLLTGEGLPVAKGPGDRVLAGSVNGDGAVTVSATSVGSDTFVAEIGRLLTDAERSRVPLQRLADRLAAVFVPVVLAIAVAAALLWLSLGGAGPTVAVLVFVTVAITACPCAFGIATPAAIVAGTGRAAESGILFRGEDAIERASQVDLVLTDKTGTLTRGRPELVALVPGPGSSEEELLALAAAVEAGSEHPLARAVRSAAARRPVAVAQAQGVRAQPGVGIEGTVEGRTVEVRRSAEAPSGADPGLTWSSVLVDGHAAGSLGFRDAPAPGARDAVLGLQADGIPVVMVTGDRFAPAAELAGTLGISEVHAGVSPAEKVELVRKFQSTGRHVAFVGDGINDAPALAVAEVGIAVGTGTDLAREAGQVILVRPGLTGVPLALRLARATVGKVRGNLSWAVGYNSVLIPIAAGALVPVLGFSVYHYLPMVGALAMGLSSAGVVANSLSLRHVMPPHGM